MRHSEWEPIYQEILEDMGYDRADDEACVRILKAVTLNSDLITDDEASERFSGTATVFGDAPCLESDISRLPPEGTLVSSGSAVARLLAIGIVPDVVVTDLDGNIDAQLEASSRGALTFIHAHGDNQDLVRMHAGRFRAGPSASPRSSVPRGCCWRASISSIPILRTGPTPSSSSGSLHGPGASSGGSRTGSL